MRNEFTRKQQQMELASLNEYITRREKELLKRHAFNQKQFPKNIKVCHWKSERDRTNSIDNVCFKIKQAEIKRQYKEAYNQQERQYKSLKEKLRSETTGHDYEAKLKLLKDDQRRKFDRLYQRYEEDVQKVLEQENVWALLNSLSRIDCCV